MLSKKQSVFSSWDIQKPATITDTENTTQAKFQSMENDVISLLSSVNWFTLGTSVHKLYSKATRSKTQYMPVQNP